MTMLTKALAAACLVLVLLLGGSGYFLRESYITNGEQLKTIEQLQTDVKNCQNDVKNAQADVSDITAANDTVVAAQAKIEKDFEKLKKDMALKKNCPITKKVSSNVEEQTEQERAAIDDIADTFRLLREANCISDPSCKRP